jgi:DNA (cytosine-5)-methyltransferase 1
MKAAVVANTENMPQKTYIDLFAGCGGLSLGLHLAGWKGLFAIEKSPFAFSTLKFNLIDNKKHFEWPDWLECKEHDIAQVLKDKKEMLKSLRGKVDLVAGGPPCQGFSMAGKRVADDFRNKLVYSYIKFIELVKPRLILFENVNGFTYAFKASSDDDKAVPYSKIVIKKLKSLGYDVKPHTITFSDYGIPQKRTRFILIGSLDSNADDFIETIKAKKRDFLIGKGLKQKSNVSDAISDLFMSNGVLPTPDRKGFNSGVYYSKPKTKFQTVMRTGYNPKNNIPDSHSFANHRKETAELFSILLKEYPEKNKRIRDSERKTWNIQKRGITILDGGRQSPTLTSHPDDYIHYAEPRILTVRECARIQSFPDWYEIKERYTTGGLNRKHEVPRYTQIGNAIPPLFAELAGIALKEM